MRRWQILPSINREAIAGYSGIWTETLISWQCNVSKLKAAAITHLQCLLELPFHHRDPFDRLIIAQALAEEMTLISDDAAFAAYPALLLPAVS
jgi:PIN domain nuclease of toxin-antitoxin system